MQQTTAAEVRPAQGKAASLWVQERAIRRFGHERRRSRSNLVAEEPPGASDGPDLVGIRRMSVQL